MVPTKLGRIEQGPEDVAETPSTLRRILSDEFKGRSSFLGRGLAAQCSQVQRFNLCVQRIGKLGQGLLQANARLRV
jgi:hypothetical protein